MAHLPHISSRQRTSKPPMLGPTRTHVNNRLHDAHLNETKTVISSYVRRSSFSLVLMLCLVSAIVELPPATQAEKSSPPEHSVDGEAGTEVHLPCLIGRQALCGEPYFIAWYKLNATLRIWTRIEATSSSGEDGAPPESSSASPPFSPSSSSAAATASPLSSRVRFVWDRVPSGHQSHEARRACEQTRRQDSRHRHDCAHLTINRVELADEGLYKCEVTFSEALDSDKCPAMTISQLSVISRPNEPELLINGRQIETNVETPASTFKEGAQVKLECQSSGGKPAPRIEWLNVTKSDGDRRPAAETHGLEVTLMRNHWPQKKAYIEMGQVTSASVSFSVSRADLRARFVCLLLPTPQLSGVSLQTAIAAQEQLLRSPAYLSSLLASQPSLASRRTNGETQLAPMFKSLQLDVQAKPSAVSISVRDLIANRTLDAYETGAPAPASFSGPILAEAAPFYALTPKRLYAIQCIVQGSRPASQVAWFNRTVPLGVRQVPLKPSSNDDFITPAPEAEHRLTSFSRSSELPDGTFRTVATILLTPSFWDNLEELFCRPSNEAFEFDELLQKAPIRSARLYVNFPPVALVELPTQAPSWTATPSGNGLNSNTVKLASDGQLVLRCLVVANPLAHNTIVQIDWIKDGHRLGVSSGSANRSLARLQIEKANHLHMPGAALPLDGAPPGAHLQARGQLVAGAKLFAASQLTLGAPLSAKLDSGAYSCSFKLIPAPGGGGSSAGGVQPPAAAANQQPTFYQQQQQPVSQRILAGTAERSIQVQVIEADAHEPPTLRLSAEQGLLVYGSHAAGRARIKSSSLDSSLDANADADANADNPSTQGQQQLLAPVLATAVVERGARLSIRCLAPPTWQVAGAGTNGEAIRFLWYINGKVSHMSSLDWHNFTATAGGTLSCALQTPPNHIKSRNEIELKLRVVPRLLRRRDLLPSKRSFSVHELANQSASRLRLACAARCEPVCSVDWLVGLRRSSSSVPPTPLSALGQIQMLEPATGSLSAHLAGTAAAAAGAFRRRYLRPLTGALTVASGAKLALLADEQLVHRGNGSRFTWSRLVQVRLVDSSATDLTVGPKSGAHDDQQPQQQQQPPQQPQAPAGNEANILSRLEISYAQLAGLLGAGRPSETELHDDELIVRCRLNALLPAQVADGLGYAFVEPGRWFPEPGLAFRVEPALNLTGGRGAGTGADNDSLLTDASGASGTNGATSTAAAAAADAGEDDNQTAADEMQISIFLDSPPRHVRVELGPSVANELVPSSAPLGARLLAQVVAGGGPSVASASVESFDGERNEVGGSASPTTLRCESPGAAKHLKWTFTDMNGTEHALPDDAGSQLSLRRVLELRRRGMGDVSTSFISGSAASLAARNLLAGNYTCTASNVHGARSATLTLFPAHEPLVVPLSDSNGLNGSSSSQQQPPRSPPMVIQGLSLPRNLLTWRLDWLFAFGCALAAGWLLYALASAFVGFTRPRKGGQGGKCSSPSTNWHFSAVRGPAHGHGREASGGALPFQAKPIASNGGANYYGAGSTNSDERDMVHSAGSQSSNTQVYDDFGPHQQQRLLALASSASQHTSQFHNQPIYFNSSNMAHHSTTLGRRVNTGVTGFKSSSNHSSSPQTTYTGAGSDSVTPILGTVGGRSQVATTMLAHGRRPSYGQQQVQPLISGNSSRISLSETSAQRAAQQRIQQQIQQQQQPDYVGRAPPLPAGRLAALNYAHHGNPETLTPSGGSRQATRGEHIYDDVIYQQMIL